MQTNQDQTPAAGVTNLTVPGVAEEELIAGEPQTFTAGDPAPVTDTNTGGTEPSVEEAQEESFDFPPRVTVNTVLIDKEVYLPLDGKGWDDAAITLALPPETSKRSAEYISALPNMDVTDTPEGAEWVATLTNGLEAGVFNDFGANAAQREGATFTNVPKGAGRPLAAGIPKIKDDDSPLLTGAKGVMRVNAILGRGSLINIPLWHSGFWVTLKTPSEGRQLEMYQRMTEDKILLGRQTHGMAFANHSVFVASAFLDMVMECIYETSVKDQGDSNDLRDMINVLDLPVLAWGLACAIWPRGFQYSRAYFDSKGLANKVVKEKLNVSYLHWLDTASVREEQLTHMASRGGGSMSKQTVSIYRDYMVRGKSKTYKLNDQINITLRVPNITQYLGAGIAWVNNIVRLIDQALGIEGDLAARNKHILSQGKATSMRQYVHWIESYEVPALDKRIENEETIAALTDSLSGDDGDRAQFFKIIGEFIDDSTVAVIATPIVDDSEKDKTKDRFPWLLPMDPISSFFTLLDQRVDQIQQRL